MANSPERYRRKRELLVAGAAAASIISILTIMDRGFPQITYPFATPPETPLPTQTLALESPTILVTAETLSTEALIKEGILHTGIKPSQKEQNLWQHIKYDSSITPRAVAVAVYFDQTLTAMENSENPYYKDTGKMLRQLTDDDTITATIVDDNPSSTITTIVLGMDQKKDAIRYMLVFDMKKLENRPDGHTLAMELVDQAEIIKTVKTFVQSDPASPLITRLANFQISHRDPAYLALFARYAAAITANAYLIEASLTGEPFLASPIEQKIAAGFVRAGYGQNSNFWDQFIKTQILPQSRNSL